MRYGVPPAGNANFAWLRYFIDHLAPHDYAGFVLANGSLSSQQSREGERTVARAMDRRARARRRRVLASLPLSPFACQNFFTTPYFYNNLNNRCCPRNRWASRMRGG